MDFAGILGTEIGDVVIDLGDEPGGDPPDCIGQNGGRRVDYAGLDARHVQRVEQGRRAGHAGEGGLLLGGGGGRCDVESRAEIVIIEINDFHRGGAGCLRFGGLRHREGRAGRRTPQKLMTVDAVFCQGVSLDRCSRPLCAGTVTGRATTER